MGDTRLLSAVTDPRSVGGTTAFMVGTSTLIREMKCALDRLAMAEVNLLLQGESGTGKRVLAEAIHRLSPRGEAPFSALTLRRASEAQMQLELFGPGGDGGLVAQARGATLYIDGIAALSVRLQRRLVREVRAQDIRGNVRMIASTAVDLDELVRVGRFLPDLYFHLALVRLTIPPLRERREDIPSMADHFIRRWCAEAGKPRIALGRAAVTELTSYPWPGNIPELEQTLGTVLRLARGAEITAKRLHAVLGPRPSRPADPDVLSLRQLERDYIATVLGRCNWNQSLAARRLGIGRNTLLRKIKSLKLERSEAA